MSEERRRSYDADMREFAERIAVLEEQQENQARVLGAMDKKLDTLLGITEMGKGAWKLVLAVGGLIVFAITVYTSFGDKVGKLFGHGG